MLYLVLGLFGVFICIRGFDEKGCCLEQSAAFSWLTSYFTSEYVSPANVLGNQNKSKLIPGKFPQVLRWTSNCIYQHYPLIALCSCVVVGVLFEYLPKHQKGQLITTILLQRGDFRRGCTSWNQCSSQWTIPTAFSDQDSCSGCRIRNQKISTEGFQLLHLE